MHYTTLREIQKCAYHKDISEKLLKYLNKTEADNEPLPLLTILKSNGIEDAIWCLRAINDDKAIRLFACDCAESVLYMWELYFNNPAPRRAIETARKYANGQANKEELDAAMEAVEAATKAVADNDDRWISNASTAATSAWSAAYDTILTAIAARIACGSWAAEVAERKKQEKLFKEYFC